VFAEVALDDGTSGFALTPPAEYLRSDTPGSVRNWAILMGRPYYWQTWAHLAKSIQTGQPVFTDVQARAPGSIV
jgi:hypothetical protein